MLMVELLSIYGTIWCCWNDDLLAKQKGIKEKYCIKLTSYRILILCKDLNPFHFISTN